MSENGYNDILQLLCNRLETISNTDVAITPDLSLIDQLSIDSIKLLNLIMEIEDTFDISVPINALADVQTVSDLAGLIHRIKSESS